jgi:tetratricopeptide (TPR) repeat protein
MSISEKVLEYDPANKEAHNLINESYYQMGRLFIQRKKYKEALDVFDRLDSGLHIPTHSGHLFRSKAATYSDPFRPAIPTHSGHP